MRAIFIATVPIFYANANAFTFAQQFMSINIQNISVVMMNNTFNPSWFLHATAGDLHLDGSTMHNVNTLIVTAALNDARLKFFRHHMPTANEGPKVKPCLAELSFCIALESVLPATGPLGVKKLQLLINQTKTYIHDGLYDFIRDTNHLKLGEKKAVKSTPSLDIEEICHRISPIIPKVRNHIMAIYPVMVTGVNLTFCFVNYRILF